MTQIITIIAFAFVLLLNLAGCTEVFQPNDRIPMNVAAQAGDAGNRFTDDTGREGVFTDQSCGRNLECQPGELCNEDRGLCFRLVTHDGDASSQGENPGEGEIPAGEGEGVVVEGEGEGSLEGEGEGAPAGEGEGEGPPPCIPSEEVCDRLDNDCDGQTDEELGGSSCGLGECATSVANCVHGVPVRCVPLQPHPETCDGLDNDCDGETDNDAAPEGWSCIPPTGPNGFLMGSPPDAANRGDDEVQHHVVITRFFLAKKTEVTQEEWEDVTEVNPSNNACGDCPVEQITWSNAVDYANALSRVEGLEQCYVFARSFTWPRGLDCTGYRLPTEAEWEYMARAGAAGDRYGPIDDIAWYNGNAEGTTHPVGQKLPNAWGLYDVLGNVYEWIWDHYGPYGGDAVDPMGPGDADLGRVNRGGAFGPAETIRLPRRVSNEAGYRDRLVGLRLVRTASPE